MTITTALVNPIIGEAQGNIGSRPCRCRMARVTVRMRVHPIDMGHRMIEEARRLIGMTLGTSASLKMPNRRTSQGAATERINMANGTLGLMDVVGDTDTRMTVGAITRPTEVAIDMTTVPNRPIRVTIQAINRRGVIKNHASNRTKGRINRPGNRRIVSSRPMTFITPKLVEGMNTIRPSPSRGKERVGTTCSTDSMTEITSHSRGLVADLELDIMDIRIMIDMVRGRHPVASNAGNIGGICHPGGNHLNNRNISSRADIGLNKGRNINSSGTITMTIGAAKAARLMFRIQLARMAIRTNSRRRITNLDIGDVGMRDSAHRSRAAGGTSAVANRGQGRATRGRGDGYRGRHGNPGQGKLIMRTDLDKIIG